MIKKLQTITNELLKDGIDFLLLSQAIKDYKKLLLNLSEFNIEEEVNRQDIYIENGKVIGATWAAMCVDDILRTKHFIKAVYKAVKHLKEKGTKPIHILYAGTGPFATLVLPLIAKFSSKELQLTLLEINDNSITSLKNVIKKLNCGNYVKIIEKVDATKYQIRQEEKYHILLSETMQHALIKEQQVPIVANLLSQLSKDIILIPERIRMDVALISWKKRKEQLLNGKSDVEYYKIIDDFFELDKGIEKYIVDGQLEFSEKSIKLPKGVEDDFNQLAILTTIDLFDGEVLKINQSGLTIPLILQNIEKEDKEKLLRIKYKLGIEPGIDYCLEYI